MLDGLPLGVENGGFELDGDRGFHAAGDHTPPGQLAEIW
jgi:hypothetical protein